MKPQGNSDGFVRYGIGSTALGPVLAALTDQGLCALRLLEKGTSLDGHLEDLQRELPKALGLVRDQAAVQPVLGQVDELLTGRRSRLDVPLDLRGTPFQQRVWKALLRVPRGSTWSYQELARKVGQPKAVRAVANACARNRVVLVVPCHRIIRSDGSLGGYGGGLAKKQKLLRLEQTAAGSPD